MKKPLSLLVLLAILVSATVTNLQAQNTKQKVNKVFINAKGGIHSHDGTQLGYIDKNNIARNRKGEKVYFIDEKGNVIDAKGNNVGRAQKNGNFYSSKGVSIMVKDKGGDICEILDSKGHSLGTVHKNYKLHACAAHCFFLKEEKVKNKP